MEQKPLVKLGVRPEAINYNEWIFYIHLENRKIKTTTEKTKQHERSKAMAEV